MMDNWKRDDMEAVRDASPKVTVPPKPALPPGVIHSSKMGRASGAFEAAAAKKIIDRLTTALHDAINSPKGVVPDSAAEFYDPERVKR